MAIPNVQPGGGSFPVFNGASQPNATIYKDGASDYLVTVQFDFGSANGMNAGVDHGGNNFRYFVINFATLSPNIILPKFKSVFISVDFDPLCAINGPYTPIQLADSTIGQLLYVGCSDSASASVNIKSAKATVCAPLFVNEGNQWMFSKRQDADVAFRGAGAAIFSTREAPAFRSVSAG